MSIAPAAPISEQDLLRYQDEAGVEFVNGQIVEKPVSVESSKTELRIGRLLGDEADHEQDEITGEAALPSFRCKVAEFFQSSATG